MIARHTTLYVEVFSPRRTVAPVNSGEMVPEVGLKPTLHEVETRCSIHLNYPGVKLVSMARFELARYYLLRIAPLPGWAT